VRKKREKKYFYTKPKKQLERGGKGIYIFGGGKRKGMCSRPFLLGKRESLVFGKTSIMFSGEREPPGAVQTKKDEGRKREKKLFLGGRTKEEAGEAC